MISLTYLDSTNSSWADNTDILFVCLLVQGSCLRLGNAFSNDCDSLNLVRKFQRFHDGRIDGTKRRKVYADCYIRMLLKGFLHLLVHWY